MKRKPQDTKSRAEPAAATGSGSWLTRLLAAGIMLVLALGATSAARQPESADTAPPVRLAGRALELWRQAEALYDEGSFARAEELYRRILAEAGEEGAPRGLDELTRSWLRLRAASAGWRSFVAAPTTDAGAIEAARGTLEEVAESEDFDLRVSALEELGDSWQQGVRGSAPAAWRYYRQALEEWAGSVDVERARRRYLDLIERASLGAADDRRGRRGSSPLVPRPPGGPPLDLLDQALRIAESAEEKAMVQSLIALTTYYQQPPRGQRPRTAAAFEAVLAEGPRTPYFAPALWHYASWLADLGRWRLDDSGAFVRSPEPAQAIEHLERLLALPAGDSSAAPFRRVAREKIEQITSPELFLGVSHVFLPGSRIQASLAWRNLEEIELFLYRLDLSSLELEGNGLADTLAKLDPGDLVTVREWREEGASERRHLSQNRELVLEPAPAGAYLLRARSGTLDSRQLIQVSERALVAKSLPGDLLLSLSSAQNGEPVAGAAISVWQESGRAGSSIVWRRLRATTDGEGLARFEPESGGSFVALTETDGGPVVLEGWVGQRPDPEVERGWKIYAFTDRPAYRPGDEVSWKILARTTAAAGADSALETPAGAELEIRLVGPEGEEVRRERVTLNEFGSAWGSYELSDEDRLGLYVATFSIRERGERERALASAPLFRLEEYKLPELTVTVSPGSRPDRGAFVAGDSIPVVVEAEYLFGGPVRGAEAEVLIFRRPYAVSPRPPVPYPFLVDERGPSSRYRPPEENVDRRLVSLDDEGRAEIEIETFAFADSDSEYRIEARVTDASRREVTGSGTVRVGRFPYYVHLQPAARVVRPGDRAEIEIRSVDVDERPHAARGEITVHRRLFVERWIDPRGRTVEGLALARMRDRGRFPDDPRAAGWRLDFRGQRQEEVARAVVATGDDGEAEYRFEVEREGHYRIAWRGLEVEAGSERPPVTADTHLFAGDRTSLDLGHRVGGVEIVLAKESVEPGEPLPLLVLTRSPDRWVLLGVDDGVASRDRGERSAGLGSYRVVYVEGTSHYVELETSAAHRPEFHVDATLVSDLRLYTDRATVTVPPADRDLDVEVVADRSTYRSGERGSLIVTTRDASGSPIPAEVALSVADSAVLQIQEELAPDPLAFFYGDRRWPLIQTQSSLHGRGFLFLEEAEEADGLARRDSNELVGDPQAAPAAPAEMRMRAEAGIQERLMVASESPLLDARASEGEGATIEVRHDFRATALWRPAVVTGDDGAATVEVDYPDSLTTWTISARAASRGDRFGSARAETVTTLPFLIRLQAPRFLVEGDLAVVSAVVNNRSDLVLDVTADLVVEGGAEIEAVAAGDGSFEPSSELPRKTVAAGGEARFDWRLSAREAGPLKLTMAARGESAEAAEPATAADADHRPPFTDAVERTIPVHAHGIEKLLTASAVLGERAPRAGAGLELPVGRLGGNEAGFEVIVSPSLATTMLDALPYLVDYPYGCTEQTLSRFVPTVIVHRTLAALGLDADRALATAFGGIEPGAPIRSESAAGLLELDAMIGEGLERLFGMQNGDGGWPWFPGGVSDPFMTGYAVWGLSLLRESGTEEDALLLDPVLAAGRRFLLDRLPEARDSIELESWLVHALAAESSTRGETTRPEPLARALDDLWQERDRLSAYGRALLLWSETVLGGGERAEVLARNLENGVRRSRDGGAVFWGETGAWWRRSDGAVETTAFALRALLGVDPDHPLVAPAARFLIDNRRGAQWSNTRDTAIVVLALSDYLRRSGELDTDTEVEVLVNGEVVERLRFTPDSVLTAPRRVRVDAAGLEPGRQRIELVRRSGSGRLYLSAEARVFTGEEPITPASSRVAVSRQLVEQLPRPTLLRGVRYQPRRLEDGDRLESGARLESVLTLEADNDVEYLIVEDLKAAGLEAVAVQSGEALWAQELASEEAGGGYTGRRIWVYQELRDRKVALFLDRLPLGRWEIRYPLRAEAPGVYHGLPAIAQAMYAPEIRGNGAEQVVPIDDGDRPRSP